MEDDWTIRLSSDLGLHAYEQDWGICNSDSARVLEFIQFFQSHTAQHRWDFEALAELIIASANDALVEGAWPAASRARFIMFVRNHSPKFRMATEYWSGLKDTPDEFPVALLLD